MMDYYNCSASHGIQASLENRNDGVEMDSARYWTVYLNSVWVLPPDDAVQTTSTE
jgi:hypothetical protein